MICGNFTERGDEAVCTNTVDSTAVRTVLALAAMHQLQVVSVDVLQAFLNAPLEPSDMERGIVTSVPNILIQAGVVPKGTTWLVKKALYGLRQAPRAWGITRDEFLRNCGWKSSTGEHCKLRQAVSDSAVWMIERPRKREPQRCRR